MLPAFSKDGGMDEKGIRDGLKRETERMNLKEETPLAKVLDLRLLKEVQHNFEIAVQTVPAVQAVQPPPVSSPAIAGEEWTRRFARLEPRKSV